MTHERHWPAQRSCCESHTRPLGRASLTVCDAWAELRGRHGTALQSGWRTSQTATPQHGSAKAPQCVEGRSPPQFLCCGSENKGRSAHSRAERGAGTAEGDGGGSQRNQPIQVRTAVNSPKCCGHRVTPLWRRHICDLPIGRWSLPLCGRPQPRSGVHRTRAPNPDLSGAGNGHRPCRHNSASRSNRRCVDRPTL